METVLPALVLCARCGFERVGPVDVVRRCPRCGDLALEALELTPAARPRRRRPSTPLVSAFADWSGREAS